MPEYILEESSSEEFKYVVYRGNNINKGSCWRGVFHSNNKSECERFINREQKKDRTKTKTLLEKMKDISKRKHILTEKYKRRMRYVKSYRDKMETYYD